MLTSSSPCVRHGRSRFDTLRTRTFFRPCRDSFIIVLVPSDESLGYFRASLWDVKSRHAKRVRSVGLLSSSPSGAAEEYAIAYDRAPVIPTPRRSRHNAVALVSRTSRLSQPNLLLDNARSRWQVAGEFAGSARHFPPDRGNFPGGFAAEGRSRRETFSFRWF